MQNYAPRTDERLSIASLLGAQGIQQAFHFIDEMRSKLDDELVRICEIPAPPFKEEARAREIARRFEEIGLLEVRLDEEGNVIAERPGLSSEPRVIVSAHLVFFFTDTATTEIYPLSLHDALPISAMLRTLKHRGPDDEGAWVGDDGARIGL